MNYTNSTEEFSQLLTIQRKLVEGRIPRFTGIGADSGESQLTPEQTVGQIRRARSLEAKGFVLFNLNQSTAVKIAPAVGAMLNAERGKPAVQP